MRANSRAAIALSSGSLAFSSVALPLAYLAIPFCTPTANVLHLSALVATAAAAAAISFGGLFVSLFSLHETGSSTSRWGLALSAISLTLATGFIVFGLALRACPS